jgi:hypothetical protein
MTLLSDWTVKSNLDWIVIIDSDPIFRGLMENLELVEGSSAKGFRPAMQGIVGLIFRTKRPNLTRGINRDPTYDGYNGLFRGRRDVLPKTSTVLTVGPNLAQADGQKIPPPFVVIWHAALVDCGCQLAATSIHLTAGASCVACIWL